MQQAVRHTRTIAALVAFTLTWNGFAHAAKPSRRLALLQATAQQAQPPVVAPAQTPAPVPQGTAPAQPLGARERMQFAHTLLLARTGNDPNFGLSDTEAYNTVLNALNQWGRYRIVTDAAGADLVLQLHGVTVADTTPGGPHNPGGTVTYASILHLTVVDPHTLAPLWEVSVPVQAALRSRTRDRNIALVGENAVSQLKLLAGDRLSRQEQAQLKQASDSHVGRFLLLGAGGLALTLGLFFLARHSAQQNAASFCQQHGLSPCPGA